jgi:carbon monoxide dehydrogenase subunit G
MKVRLERTFPVPGGPDSAWAVLADIETVAACMPGARITERVDDTHYKGTVAVRLGPASLMFRGEIEVKACDHATRTLQLSAKGTDTTGSSVASMDLTARIEPAADGNSVLVGSSEAAVGGKAAAFGSRMMDAVSEQILKQFGANFAAKVTERNALAQADAVAAISEAAGTASGARTAPRPAAAAGSTAPATPSELNGLALLWAIVRDWFRKLFSRRTS